MADQIPYGRQLINEADIQAVVDVLKSDWLTQGPAVERFERTVAEYCGARYAVAVNSATSALHIACLAAGLGPGDILWTSPNTFVASANCGLSCGALVDFVDIDPLTCNMSAERLAEKLEAANGAGMLPKVVIPVHFAGQSCEMATIRKLSERYGFAVVEDASHAIGGNYGECKVGSCTFSDMTVFSFHPVKIITTGEGGMVLTNNADMYQKFLRLRSHGITRDTIMMTGEIHGPWYYQQVELGFNYRMTDIQAALGTSQMSRLDEFVARRNLLANRYHEAFIGMPVTVPLQLSRAYSSFHLYVIRLKLDQINKSRRDVFAALREQGILVNIHYIPVHTHPYYQQLGFNTGDFPEAERYYAEAISLPIFAALTEQQQDHIIQSLYRCLS